MYDKENNKFYYEVSNNVSPETLKKIRAVLDELGKGTISEEEFVEKHAEVSKSALCNFVSVSKHTDITLMSNAINGLNNIISILDYAANQVACRAVPSEKNDSESQMESEDGDSSNEDIFEDIYNLIDGAIDDLFGVRQTVVDLCSE